METTECVQCGTTFQSYKTGQKYCSRPCFFESRKRFAICRNCGNEYHASGQGTNKKKFCSAACYHQHRVRENHPLWAEGGSRVAGEGYLRRLIYPENPYYEMGRKHSKSSRDVLEHRLVMAESLGRVLRPDETVHHKNGDRADNRIENLELRIGKHGKGATHAHCPTCTCFEG